MKLNRLRQTRNFGIVLLLLAIPLWQSSSFGQGVCFDDATAGAMVQELEKARIAEQQLSVQVSGNTELQGQLDILRGTIKLYEEQVMVYKNMIDMNQKMGDMKDKACQEQIKAITPTFMDNMAKYLTGAGIMGMLGIMAILIL